MGRQRDWVSGFSRSSPLAGAAPLFPRCAHPVDHWRDQRDEVVEQGVAGRGLTPLAALSSVQSEVIDAWANKALVVRRVCG